MGNSCSHEKQRCNAEKNEMRRTMLIERENNSTTIPTTNQQSKLAEELQQCDTKLAEKELQASYHQRGKYVHLPESNCATNSAGEVILNVLYDDSLLDQLGTNREYWKNVLGSAQCRAECDLDQNCSVAVYNNITNTCWLKNGELTGCGEDANFDSSVRKKEYSEYISRGRPSQNQ